MTISIALLASALNFTPENTGTAHFDGFLVEEL